MKFSQMYWLLCDGSDDDCEASSEPNFSKQEAITLAKSCGWLIKGNKAYCPSCKHQVNLRKDHEKSASN